MKWTLYLLMVHFCCHCQPHRPNGNSDDHQRSTLTAFTRQGTSTELRN